MSHYHINAIAISPVGEAALAQLLSARDQCGGSGIDSQVSKTGTVSTTACHRCNVSSELSCPGAKPRR